MGRNSKVFPEVLVPEERQITTSFANDNGKTLANCAKFAIQYSHRHDFGPKRIIASIEDPTAERRYVVFTDYQAKEG